MTADIGTEQSGIPIYTKYYGYERGKYAICLRFSAL